VPEPVSPLEHRIKYRLVNVRVVGYDNERGKGDHKHRYGDHAIGVLRLTFGFCRF
jgi:hypothetical protein